MCIRDSLKAGEALKQYWIIPTVLLCVFAVGVWWLLKTTKGNVALRRLTGKVFSTKSIVKRLNSARVSSAFSMAFNIMEIFIKPLSLCMRLFGNVLGSFVIMELLKLIVPAVLPAVFSCYFDIFDGLIQAYVFVFLTGLFIKEATE